MKNKKIVNSTPPPRFVCSNRRCRCVWRGVCAVFGLALVGCGNTYTDEDDYANFIRWQARYETEKELVGLLRDYDAAYSGYLVYIDKTSDMYNKPDSSSIAFVFEGRTVLTDENIKLVQTSFDAASDGYVVTVTFDSVGTAIFADLTANHIGGTIEIIETHNGNSSVISSPYINTAITNGVAQISGFSEASANELFLRIAAKTAERSVQRFAAAYNEKRAEYAARYSMPEYLPSALPTQPQYSDVSPYLQKAEALGFTV